MVLYSGKENHNTLLVHAGVLPQWDVTQTLELADELQQALRSKNYKKNLIQMYGNQPDRWSDRLKDMDRLRVVINAFTRLRFCSSKGVMEFISKEGIGDTPRGYMPWFDVPNRKTQDVRIVFGHWSTLGLIQRKDIISLDTGCVWGGVLTAASLGKKTKIIHVPGQKRPVGF